MKAKASPRKASPRKKKTLAVVVEPVEETKPVAKKVSKKKKKPAPRKLKARPLKAVDQAVGSVLLDIDGALRKLNRKLDGLADAADEMKLRVQKMVTRGLGKMLLKLGPARTPAKPKKTKRTKRKKSTK